MTNRVGANTHTRSGPEFLDSVDGSRFSGEQNVGIAGFGGAQIDKYKDIVIASRQAQNGSRNHRAGGTDLEPIGFRGIKVVRRLSPRGAVHELHHDSRGARYVLLQIRHQSSGLKFSRATGASTANDRDRLASIIGRLRERLMRGQKGDSDK